MRLTLSDDGVGLPAQGLPRSGHYGLRWLTERVESLHGTLALAPVEPHGAQLAVHLPLNPESE